MVPGESFHSRVVGCDGNDLRGLGVSDPLEFTILAIVPGGTVFENEELAFGPHGHVSGVHKAIFSEPWLIPFDVSFFIEFDQANAGRGPVVGNEASVELWRKTSLIFREQVGVKNRSGAGRGSGVVPKSRLGGGEFGEARVVDRGVDWLPGVKLCPGLFSHKVVVGIGFVVGAEVGPAEVAGLAGLIDFIITARATIRVPAGIGSHFSPVEVVALLVDGDPVGIAATHDINFGTGFRGSFREKVSVGNGVAAISRWFNAEDLPAKVVGVGGGALGVIPLAVMSLVDGSGAI